MYKEKVSNPVHKNNIYTNNKEKIMKINQAMIESYVRNLVGQIIGAATIVAATTHVAISSFGGHEWLLVANSLWASLVPVALRYVNKKDPAFGMVAQLATSAVTKKLDEAAKPKKAPAKKPASK
jgi:hypothetical protein